MAYVELSSINDPNTSEEQRRIDFLRTLFLNPELLKTRKIVGNILSGYHKNLSKWIQKGYTPRLVNEIEELVAYLGFVSQKEIEGIHNGQPLRNTHIGERINPDFNTAVRKVQDWRSQGLRVGFVSGSFDPPHLLHTRLFNETRKLGHCDRLIVGINSNEYVQRKRRNAEDPRPRFPQQFWRMEQIASLPSVDLVFRLPIISKQINAERSQEAYYYLYQALGIDVVGFGATSERQDQRIQSLKALGIQAVTVSHDIDWSSTIMTKHLRDSHITGYSLKSTRRRARFGEIRARARSALNL